MGKPLLATCMMTGAFKVTGGLWKAIWRTRQARWLRLEQGGRTLGSGSWRGEQPRWLGVSNCRGTCSGWLWDVCHICQVAFLLIIGLVLSYLCVLRVTCWLVSPIRTKCCFLGGFWCWFSWWFLMLLSGWSHEENCGLTLVVFWTFLFWTGFPFVGQPQKIFMVACWLRPSPSVAKKLCNCFCIISVD